LPKEGEGNMKFDMKLFLILIFLSILFNYPVFAGSILNNSFETTNIPLPQLQQNSSQEIVILKEELNPGQTINTISQLTANEYPETIPLGSVIIHLENKTTVFDSSGRQLFIADDLQSRSVHTPNGNVSATFIHEIPDNSTIVIDNNTLHVFKDNARILTIIRQDFVQTGIPTIPVVCIGPPPGSWIC
jgi:hypothetical protein